MESDLPHIVNLINSVIGVGILERFFFFSKLFDLCTENGQNVFAHMIIWIES